MAKAKKSTKVNGFLKTLFTSYEDGYSSLTAISKDGSFGDKFAEYKLVSIHKVTSPEVVVEKIYEAK